MTPALQNFSYLVAAALFIVGLKMMSHPRTAVRGNAIGALGMLIAIIVTLLDKQVLGSGWSAYVIIATAMVVGSAIGAWLALRVKMTAMPEMVALLNGSGGLASVLVAGAALHEELFHYEARAREAGRLLQDARQSAESVFVDLADPSILAQTLIAIAASGLIGGITFTGSIAAWGKLQDLKWLDKFIFPWQKAVNAALALIVIALSWILISNPQEAWIYWLIVALSFVLGVLLVTPIGGADMPVVISLLNSYSGIAGAATGFVLNNTVLIIAGSLVGASGIILTKIMCKAMNRSLTNVLFGGMGVGTPSPNRGTADAIYAQVKSASADEIAMLFDSAQRVMIVPGYGMAVSQAQHAVRDLAKLLESRGTNVEYAIHPVAGRMPGHMNVLLAEADVPYDQLKEMDEANSEMEQIDIAIVIGANDTVNPIARTDPKSPIAGMPIINVDKARTVVVIKRSLSPGFAGIANPLFANANTLMYFADGQKAVNDIIAAIKSA
jgi:H+-translocating NAD(P) transhydrogenase subunit beta